MTRKSFHEHQIEKEF